MPRRDNPLTPGTPADTWLLCDGLRPIDVDVDNATIADEIEALAAKMLGVGALVRCRNNSVRRAMLYRAAEGEPGSTSRSGAVGKVEVLGRGRQLHVCGTHYSGAELQWRPRPPWDLARCDLQAVAETKVAAFVDAVAPMLDASVAGSSSDFTRPPSRVAGPPVELESRPPYLKHQIRLNPAGCTSRYSLSEVEAVVESIPNGYSGHPLGTGEEWRSEFLFPLADFAARHPEHRNRVAQLFQIHTRRIADPALVNAWSDGVEAYFAAADSRFDAEVARRRNGSIGSTNLITIDRLIGSALGNREEALAAGWGGHWDGWTKQHREARPAGDVGSDAGGGRSAANPFEAAAHHWGNTT